MKNLVLFLRSGAFVKNLVIALTLVFLILFVIYKVLNYYTLHGQEIKVPDLKGKSLNQVSGVFESLKLRYQVLDSAVYDPRMAPGAIVQQDPEPNEKVKENRTIYLTINASTPPKVKMPDLVDLSYRQAEAILMSNGLKVGELIYKPDLAKNAVLGQKYKGKDVKPGTLVKKGASIDLVLGDGLDDTETDVPNLINLTYSEAVAEIKSASLNLGAVIYDDKKDTAGAKVYKQRPSSAQGKISFGESVDIFLTRNFKKIKLDPSDVEP